MAKLSGCYPSERDLLDQFDEDRKREGLQKEGGVADEGRDSNRKPNRHILSDVEGQTKERCESKGRKRLVPGVNIRLM